MMGVSLSVEREGPAAVLNLVASNAFLRSTES
jgi:hypothetical protein